MKLTRCCLLLLATTLLLRSDQVCDRCGVDGFVTSDIAGALPGATVEINSVTRGFHRRAVTDQSGYYLLDNLEPGAYSLWAEANGMGCIIVPRVAVFAGKRIRQDFHFARARRPADACEPQKRKVK